MKQAQDLTGVQFGSLVVTRRAPNVGIRIMWACECECGAATTVWAHSLKSGATKSCGCRRGAENRTRAVHGMSRTPIHEIWLGMRKRCLQPNSPNYFRYGARGITVCDRWRDSFQNFYEDMGPRPSPEHSLDRIDNDKGYSPENCRWATRKQQGNNKSNNVRFVVDGQSLTATQCAAMAKISLSGFLARIRQGWAIERAISPTATLRAQASAA